MRHAPSSSENSVCRCRWTNSAGITALNAESAELAEKGSLSFPFYGRWRFGGDVIDDAVDAADFVHDARRDAREQIVRQARPVGGHAVPAFDGANRHGVFVRALVAHDAHA